MAHRPLRDRENPLSSDVADAIFNLIRHRKQSDLFALPVAFDIQIIVAELISIACTDDEGLVNPPPPIVRRALSEKFDNRLRNTAIFQAGYKHFEEGHKLPIVPVTDFFFKHVYDGNGAQQCLDAMSDHEITQSLPKRKGRIPVHDASGEVVDYERDDQGDVAKYGELAGIIVFNANGNASILRRWLTRKANVATGVLDSAVNSIEHARPAAVAVDVLKQHTRQVSGVIRKALPRPMRKE